MLEGGEELRAQLEQSRPARASAGYPHELRVRAGAWLRAQRVAGVSWDRLGEQLGVSRTTVRSWATAAKKARRSSATDFLAVEVQVEPLLPRQPTLVSPRGFRVEGLELGQLVELLGQLG